MNASARRQRRTPLALIMIVGLLGSMLVAPAAFASDHLDDFENSTAWGGQGTDSEACDKDGEGPRDGSWIHWVIPQPQDSTNHLLVVNGDEYVPGPPFQAAIVHFYTPFYDLNEVDATVYYDGGPITGPGLVISDYCPGDEPLTVQALLSGTKFEDTLGGDTIAHWPIHIFELPLDDPAAPLATVYTDAEGDWTYQTPEIEVDDADDTLSYAVCEEQLAGWKQLLPVADADTITIDGYGVCYVVVIGVDDTAVSGLDFVNTWDVWEGETAWAEGTRYTNRGNWATYHTMDGEDTVDLLAGQTIYAGDVTFSPENGEVTITIELADGWRLNPDTSEAVKIQGYASAPSGNPAPGQFTTYKGNDLEVTVDAYPYYGVHVDVEQRTDPIYPTAPEA